MVLLYQLSLGIARFDILEIYGKFLLRMIDDNRRKVKNMV